MNKATKFIIGAFVVLGIIIVRTLFLEHEADRKSTKEAYLLQM